MGGRFSRRGVLGPMLPGVRRRRYRLRSAGLLSLAIAIVLGLAAADRKGVFGRSAKPDFQKYNDVQATVMRVVDGDTLDIDISDGPHSTTRIRLWGVDTPETVKPNTPVQHFGLQACQASRTLALYKHVRLELIARDTRDKYDRLLAYVFLPDGRLLNAVLIEDGLGYADPRFDHPRKRDFTRLQKQAKSASKGLWKDATDADLPYYLQPRPSMN